MDVHVFAEPGIDSPVWIDGRPVAPEDLGVTAAAAALARHWVEMVAAGSSAPLEVSGPYQQGQSHEQQVALLGAWVANRVRDAVTADVVHYHLPGGEAVVVARRHERERVRLRVFPEWSAGLPIWGEFVSECGVGSLPADLAARLVAWNDEWQQSAVPETGAWVGSSPECDHRDRGRALAAELATYLGDDYEVVYGG